MIFDQPPAELPVATLRPRDSGEQLLLAVRGWLASKWRWLRPRAIPVAVAFAGMLAVLASASYLRELAHQPPQQLAAEMLVAEASGADPATAAAVEQARANKQHGPSAQHGKHGKHGAATARPLCRLPETTSAAH